MSFEEIMRRRGVDTNRIEAMYARERQQRQREANGKPWRLMGLEFGRPAIVSAHDTRAEALEALIAIRRTCAPFVRDTFRIEEVRP